jgi:hypothetical protein
MNKVLSISMVAGFVVATFAGASSAAGKKDNPAANPPRMHPRAECLERNGIRADPETGLSAVRGGVPGAMVEVINQCMRDKGLL